ncbi:heavy-metal-associated domain-containing protein [Tannockella kyphosi]|uniref:heavy-metal-associated domain-containing protein n=1 Tax=Tannockella kyphosi TaxID=2899121 RepID=UPI00201358E4|nr:heavy metal-associated domain-containing protein [Tannockella kyphosi]
MINIIIGAIIIGLIAFGGYRTWLQLSGKRTCCGGTKEKVKKKKVDGVIGTIFIHIEGMHCAHCEATITNTLNSIEGVSAKVELSKNQAIVSYNKEISDCILKEAIEKKGFIVKSIERV